MYLIRRSYPLLLLILLLAAPALAQKPKGQVKASAIVSPESSSNKKKNASGRETGSSKKSADIPMPPSTDGVGDEYRIGVEDELMISVWREAELSMGVVVRPDGKISLPLLNEVKVVGLSPRELQTILVERFKDFVNEPQVTVIVRTIRSRRVYLVGQVGRPGVYILNGKKTVLELLAEAGGLGPFAKGGSIYVLRNVNGRQVRIPFDFKKVIRGHSSKRDVQLEPGDMVVVP